MNQLPTPRPVGRFVSLVVLLACAGSAAAQQPRTLSVLASNAIHEPLVTVAEEYKRQTGIDVRIRFETSTAIARLLAAGEVKDVDVLITTPAGIDQAVKDGKAAGGSRAVLGKVPVGVAIRRGARVPDVSSPDALKAAILAADAVLYSRGASGVYVEKLLRDLGVAEQVKARAVQTATGDEMLERLAAGRGHDIGFTQVSEIKRAEAHAAVQLVAPLPAAVQNYTPFDAAAMAASASPDAARAFVRALTTPAARKTLAASGWEF